MNAKFALRSTISLLLAVVMALPTSALCVESTPQSSTAGGEICFPLSDGNKILEGFDKGGECRDALEACGNRSTTLEGRVGELAGEVKRAEQTLEDTRKAGGQAVKAAAPPWDKRIIDVAKWIGLGIALGFVVGASK